MTFAVSILATLLFIVVSSLPEHVYGDKTCEKNAMMAFYEKITPQMKVVDGLFTIEDIKTYFNIDRINSARAASDVAKLAEKLDLVNNKDIITHGQTLVNEIITCKSTDIWHSRLGNDEPRTCDYFKTIFERTKLSLPEKFNETCP